MRHNPFKIVEMFEETVADYTGAPYAVSVNSCTNALPYPIYDSAKRLTSGMYIPGSFMTLSFHIKKHLKMGKGGMILTDNKEAAEWFLRARYEGRSKVKYHEDNIEICGWNMYMTPQEAAHGLALMQNFPEHNEDLPENPPYRDLREFELFKNVEVAG